MLDIGWQELLVIGALALIVVGPKDLPGMLRSFGQWVGRMRGMATDFQRAMNDAARQADMGNLKELTDLKNTMSGGLDIKSQAVKAVTGSGSGSDSSAETKVTKIDAAAEHAANTASADDAPAEPAEPASTAMTQSAPVDKPDPSKMGDAMPVEEPMAKAAEK